VKPEWITHVYPIVRRMMATARVSSKGQITLPREVRKRLGIGPGDEVEFLEENGRYFLKKKVKVSPFDQYLGFLQNDKGSDPDQIIRELRGEE
jgi:antitoxin PrlF